MKRILFLLIDYNSLFKCLHLFRHEWLLDPWLIEECMIDRVVYVLKTGLIEIFIA